jgi:hypothetical protein
MKGYLWLNPLAPACLPNVSLMQKDNQYPTRHLTLFHDLDDVP